MQHIPNNKDEGYAPYQEHSQQMNDLSVAFKHGSLIIAIGFRFQLEQRSEYRHAHKDIDRDESDTNCRMHFAHPLET